MSMRGLLISALLIGSAYPQVEGGGVVPKMRTAVFRSGSTITLRLSLGYVSAVHVPEPVSSIAIGDPSAFRAEHSEVEPELVFFKPLSAQPARSNADIVTRNGTVLTLALVSYGRAPAGSEIDFLVDCRRAVSAVVAGASDQKLDRPAPPTSSSNWRDEERAQANAVEEEIRRQSKLSLALEGGGLQAAVGRSRELGNETIVAFSARNGSDAPIELLPPQMELSTEQTGKKRRLISDPVPVLAYRISRRRLESGERADGVVLFERPASKATAAGLQLRLAQADKADHPIVLAVPFIPAVPEEQP